MPDRSIPDTGRILSGSSGPFRVRLHEPTR
jgi:hypothetical protein